MDYTNIFQCCKGYCKQTNQPIPEVACSASDRHGSNFEFCVCRAVSSHSSHHPEEIILAQFSLYVYKSGLKPHPFHLIFGKSYSPAGFLGVDLCRN